MKRVQTTNEVAYPAGWTQTGRSQQMGTIPKTKPPRFFPDDLPVAVQLTPPLPQSVWIGRLVVRLVDGHHGCAGIYYRSAQAARLVDQPRIPGCPADTQRWNESPHAFRKSKEIAIARGRGLFTMTADEIPQAIFTAPCTEIPNLTDQNVPAAAHHKESPLRLRNFAERFQKIAHQHNVRIDVAKDVMSGDALGFLKQIREQRRTKFRAR